jgi:hypothetical protein
VDGVLYEVPLWASQLPNEERVRFHQQPMSP